MSHTTSFTNVHRYAALLAAEAAALEARLMQQLTWAGIVVAVLVAGLCCYGYRVGNTSQQETGINLIQLLTMQLNGVITMNNEPGLMISIVFQEEREMGSNTRNL
ncbi:hypothetical protein MKQ68_15005 [Chitinophaga horti]|uniref:Uncharacterized protein n=1 Tax=Chitinophaga horti TaxID=2920382 RepID=A0ABY6IVK3_9BACT|nr:hypothetical protein [Chitinophaga horti]UYQ91401.1 hypothetical protein MKQ68_15005 [Chitinophaga horti]